MTRGSSTAGRTPETHRQAKRRLRRPSVRLVGFGAFSQLFAMHIGARFHVMVYDPAPGLKERATKLGVTPAELAAVAQCDVLVLAAPDSSLRQFVDAIAPFCLPNAMVLDVASVKIGPAKVMRNGLPDHVQIVATPLLFGPESAKEGIAGFKVAVCPVRGSPRRLVSFLQEQMCLEVIETTPAEHAREVATVQGLTHLFAKVLLDMGPILTRMPTRNFDLLSEAISMVRNDASEVFEATEKANPYSQSVRRQFFERAWVLEESLRATVCPVGVSCNENGQGTMQSKDIQ